jgi:hypothetical protein
MLQLEHSLVRWLKLGHFGKYIRNTLNVWECGSGEEWRLVRPTVWKIKKYYEESRKGGTSHIQYV